jgi:hypothetical protein
MVGGVGMGEGQEMIEVEADDVGGAGKRAKVRRIGGRQEAGEEGALTGCGRGGDY